MYDKETHKRRSIRIKEYDYSQANWYYITICTYDKECIFGDIKKVEMVLNEYGQVAEKCMNDIPEHNQLMKLDYCCVMPNHVHLIIIIDTDIRKGTACRAPTPEGFGKPVPGSIPTIVRTYKSAVTRLINILRKTPGEPVWQRNYYEHIIRNDMELYKIRQYIHNNPIKWEDDDYYKFDWN